MAQLTDEEAEKANRTRVFMLEDPAAVKKYIAFCNKHTRDIKACRKEVLALTGRDAAMYDRRDYVYMAGINVNPEDWREKETARLKTEAEANGTQWHSWWGVKDAPIPDGWRKRVKDNYLSPPLRGGGPEADAARALVKKYARIEGPRGYMKRVHGVKTLVFAGLSMVTIGIDVVGPKGAEVVYVISKGPEQSVKDLILMTEIKHSAYLAAKGE